MPNLSCPRIASEVHESPVDISHGLVSSPAVASAVGALLTDHLVFLNVSAFVVTPNDNLLSETFP
ncbi:TPA: hypothetical protein DCZ39_07540 [Patescibacteria group bacterium]|nr:hypothetical protein [Candidatus Gracilibacteria bacterium]